MYQFAVVFFIFVFYSDLGNIYKFQGLKLYIYVVGEGNGSCRFFIFLKELFEHRVDLSLWHALVDVHNHYQDVGSTVLVFLPELKYRTRLC